MWHIINVSGNYGLNALVYVETGERLKDVRVSIIRDFDELVRDAQRFRLKFNDLEAVKNVRLHVDVGDEADDFVALLDNFV